MTPGTLELQMLLEAELERETFRSEREALQTERDSLRQQLTDCQIALAQAQSDVGKALVQGRLEGEQSATKATSQAIDSVSQRVSLMEQKPKEVLASINGCDIVVERDAANLIRKLKVQYQ